MSDKRASPGVRLPTLWQLVLIASVSCAAWLIWSHRDAFFPGPPATGVSAADQAAVLDHLHSVETVSQDSEGIQSLVGELTNSNPRMRRNALLALRRFGPDAQAALSSIRDRLADDDSQVREFAITTYWNVRQDPNDVTSIVSAMLGDEGPDVRAAAVTVLETIGPPAVGPVTEQLRRDALRSWVPGLQVLRRTGWDENQVETEEVVRSLAHNPDAATRLEALLTLATWGRPGSAEIRELLLQVPASADSHPSGPRRDPGPQETALNAIIRMGPAAVENLPDLLALLPKERGAFQLRDRILQALRSMGKAALPAAPQLFQMFDDLQDTRRFDVGWTLLEIGADPAEIARVVIPFLADHDSDVAFHAGRLCAHASPDEARRQVATLIPQLNAGTPAARYSALNAIWGLAPHSAEAIPALLPLLESSNVNTAGTSARALGDMGQAVAPALPALLTLLKRNSPALDPRIRRVIFLALGKLGPEAHSAIPTLLEELNNPRFLRPPRGQPAQREPAPVLEVISALVYIGGTDPDVLSALRRLLSSESGDVRRAALSGIGQLRPDSPDTLRDFLSYLGERSGTPASDGRVRLAVILAIGNLGADRTVAVEPLIAELDNVDPMICKAACLTLGRIGPPAIGALPRLRELVLEWKNSLFDPNDQTVQPNVPIYDDPRSRIERARWANDSELLPLIIFDVRTQQRLTTKSVQQAARDAIVAIEQRDSR